MELITDEKGRTIVDYFMYYIFNRWCHSEAIAIYGENLGNHIFDKWKELMERGGEQLVWYANLDTTCRRKLVERALEYYNKEKL